jgi:hypothetical protein
MLSINIFFENPLKTTFFLQNIKTDRNRDTKFSNVDFGIQTPNYFVFCQNSKLKKFLSQYYIQIHSTGKVPDGIHAISIFNAIFF